MAKNLVLYMRPTCPFCLKVLRYMKKNDIEVPLKNIMEDPQALKELETIGGKNQVPCLFIDGKPLYESDDIIEFLSKEFDVD